MATVPLLSDADATPLAVLGAVKGYPWREIYYTWWATT